MVKEKNPRYSRITDLIELILFMQSRTQGVSINDIQERFGVRRRTAERMRNCLTDALPQINVINIRDKQKLWGFTRGHLNELINFTPEEIANLENLKVLQEKQNFNEKSKLLDDVVTKVKAFNRNSLFAFNDKIELLLQIEGYAVKQVPQDKVDIELLSKIREALIKPCKITAIYNNKEKVLSPYGIIYGEKIYLVAREEIKGPDPYMYLLHKLCNVQLINENFDKGEFDLQTYSERSFGVYQNEIFEVSLRFNPEIANEVLNYHFHPTQKMQTQDDGSVIVKFKASGSLEICWHLLKWGTDVQILSPKSLKNQYYNLLERILSNKNA